MRATLARGGLAGMAEDAERAYALEPEASPWRATCRLLGGTALQLMNRGDEAIRQLQEGARLAAITAPHVHALCLTQLAIAVLPREEWDDATELATRARAQVERHDLGAYPTSALVFAASALVRAHRGLIDAARQDFTAALCLRGRLVEFAAWYDVELAVVLAEAALRLGDLGRTRDLLRDANRMIRPLPDAQTLALWIEKSSSRLESVLGPGGTLPSSLTTAELRILRYLPTHLSFREIAERVYVSVHTVRSQANAVYRKLEVSGRSEAVARARSLGFLDAKAAARGPLSDG